MEKKTEQIREMLSFVIPCYGSELTIEVYTTQIDAGWSSMIVAVTFIGGMILFMLGIVGEYIGRIYICMNQAPQYVIREIVSQEAVQAAPDS